VRKLRDADPGSAVGPMEVHARLIGTRLPDSVGPERTTTFGFSPGTVQGLAVARFISADRRRQVWRLGRGYQSPGFRLLPMKRWRRR
jgi:hypothetical protein